MNKSIPIISLCYIIAFILLGIVFIYPILSVTTLSEIPNLPLSQIVVISLYFILGISFLLFAIGIIVMYLMDEGL